MSPTSAPSTSPTRVGCAGLPPGMRRARYFERLNLLETDVAFAARLKPSVARRWRAEAPEHTEFAVVASLRVTHRPDRALARRHKPALGDDERARAGHFGDTDVVRAGLADTADVAEHLDAAAIVFRTPASFTPTATHRDAMTRFFRGDAAGRFGDRALVWDPAGVWQDDEAYRLADDLGLVLARDPLTPEPPEIRGDAVYLRVTGLGQARRSFSDDQLDVLAELVAGRSRAWVVFGNPDRFRDARRLAALLG